MDQAVNISLKNRAAQEKDLLTLYLSITVYISAYIKKYPTPVDSRQFRPQTANSAEAYDYLMSEIFTGTVWRDGLNVQEQMSEILLGLKMSLLERLALEAESGYLASVLFSCPFTVTKWPSLSLTKSWMTDLSHRQQSLKVSGLFPSTSLINLNTFWQN